MYSISGTEVTFSQGGCIENFQVTDIIQNSGADLGDGEFSETSIRDYLKEWNNEEIEDFIEFINSGDVEKIF